MTSTDIAELGPNDPVMIKAWDQAKRAYERAVGKLQSAEESNQVLSQRNEELIKMHEETKQLIDKLTSKVQSFESITKDKENEISSLQLELEASKNEINQLKTELNYCTDVNNNLHEESTNANKQKEILAHEKDQIRNINLHFEHTISILREKLYLNECSRCMMPINATSRHNYSRPSYPSGGNRPAGAAYPRMMYQPHPRENMGMEHMKYDGASDYRDTFGAYAYDMEPPPCDRFGEQGYYHPQSPHGMSHGM